MITKPDLRSEVRARRRQLDPDWVRQTSRRVQARVLALDEWTSAQCVCCYLATPTEVQTGELIDACRQAEKQVWAPAWRSETGCYEFVRFAPGIAPIPGHCGIPEPANPAWGAWENVRPQTPAGGNRPGGRRAMVITPGLAFDRHGGRVGHGGGHYDRLFAQPALASALKIGLAFGFQLRDAVPTTARDAIMDIVVTEDAVIRCRTE